jgi:hypothetical protein
VVSKKNASAGKLDVIGTDRDVEPEHDGLTSTLTRTLRLTAAKRYVDV